MTQPDPLAAISPNKQIAAREVTASTCTTATETITTIVTEAWDSTDPDLTLM
jgi:hypothetical protein